MLLAIILGQVNNVDPIKCINLACAHILYWWCFRFCL